MRTRGLAGVGAITAGVPAGIPAEEERPARAPAAPAPPGAPAAPGGRLSVAALVYLRGRDADARLRGLEAQRAGARPVLGALAGRLRATRGWRALGFRSLSDYAREQLGVGARAVSEWARVWEALAELPRLRAAACAGEVPWTVARLVAGVATPETDAACLASARGRTVRAVEALVATWRAAREAEATGGRCVPAPGEREEEDSVPVFRAPTEDPEAKEDDRVAVRLACGPAVALKWDLAVELGRRSAGESLPVWAGAECIVAEAASALPPKAEARQATGSGPRDAAESGREGERAAGTTARGTPPPLPTDPEPGLRHWAFPHVRWPVLRTGKGGEVGDAADTGKDGEIGYAAETGDGREIGYAAETGDAGEAGVDDGDTFADAFAPLVEGLEACGPHEVDRRLREAVAFLQGLDQEMGRILRQVVDRRLYRELGFESFERYVGERLDLSSRTARRLVRLARAEHSAPQVADAFRAGRITALQAETVLAALAGRVPRPPAPDRRLPEVEALAHTRGRLEPELPWLALAERTTLRRLEDEAGAGPRRAIAFHAPPEVAAFFWETLERVRRWLERREELARGAEPAGGLAAPGAPAEPTVPTGEPRPGSRPGPPAPLRVPLECALEAMLDHAIATWWEQGTQFRDYADFGRDGYRCTVPGCTARAELESHHVVFRSAGGPDEPANRTTLCWFHHHRGVHAGRVRIRGRAPDALVFELGVRPDGPPLARYRSGDVRVDGPT